MSVIKSTHPLYDKFLPIWERLEDCFEGEDTIKAKGVKYLPPTPGQVLDGMALVGSCSEKSAGFVSYTNYKERAVFPDFYTEGVKTLVGILNEKPAKITVPKNMEYLLAQATSSRNDIQTFLRSIHKELLTTGRLGIFADMEKNPDPLNPKFYFECYGAKKVRNWDEGAFNGGENRLNMVVLDESGYERQNDFQWRFVEKFRVLSLGDISEDSDMGTYQFSEEILTGVAADTDNYVQASYKGRPSQEIPFIFINPNDLNSSPDQPPLDGLSRICLTIYKGEADYRFTLFMQGQETLVVIGGIKVPSPEGSEAALRVGADARIDIDLGGDAKYIGIGSQGISEQRAALEADREQAAVRTGQLLAPGKMSMESGEALKTRVAAQTSTLTSIACSAAAGLEQLLKIIARWMGEDDSVVSVTPNLDFTNFQIQGQDLVQMITAKRLGFPLSFRSIHDVARERGVTRKTFEEELQEIKDDPRELVELLQQNEELTGNNPQNAAGGPKGNVTPKQKTNQPKK